MRAELTGDSASAWFIKNKKRVSFLDLRGSHQENEGKSFLGSSFSDSVIITFLFFLGCSFVLVRQASQPGGPHTFAILLWDQ